MRVEEWKGKTRNVREPGANHFKITSKQKKRSGLQLDAAYRTLAQNFKGVLQKIKGRAASTGLHFGQMATLETSLVAYYIKCKLYNREQRGCVELRNSKG